MAERKATNKYYPPGWTPEKGSLNTYLGSHPLRDRARKLHQGIIIIRFELPYNIWCNGCGSHVGMGVRYNAEKTTVGKYYSTPIFKFRMKCHLCDNYFEIQTDPKNLDYEIVSGASRKNERWEHTEGETVAVGGPSEAAKLAADPMYRLEHGARDKSKAEEDAPRINRIIAMQKDQLDDFHLNQIARRKFREEKVQLRAHEEEEKQLKKKASLSIPLVEEREEDKERAKKTVFAAGSSREDRKRRRMEIRTQPVLGGVEGEGSKRARQALLKACTRMDSGVFGKSGQSPASTRELRHSLGIRTTRSNST